LPPALTLEEVAAGGDAVMSNVDNVITTTTNTVVASANTAVSIGRWSSLAIIASSFLSLWEGGCLYSAFRNHQLALRLIDTTSFVAVC
jgi:hypothetical protein